MITSLTKIKAFIHTYGELNNAEISAATLEELKTFAGHAVTSLILNIDDEIVLKKDERERLLFTEQLQLALIGIIDDLAKISRGSDDLSGIFVWLDTELIGLLEHLHQYFGSYFSNEVPVPASFVILHKRKIYPESIELVAQFRKMVSDENLTDLFSSFLLANNVKDRFFIRKWNQWLFYKNFIAEATLFFNGALPEEPSIAVMKLFIELNFNSLYVYSYFLKFMDGISSRDADDEEIEHELFYLLKIFRQINTRYQKGFDPESKTLKELIRGAITAELKYISQKNKLFQKVSKGTEEPGVSRYYFMVMVTLAELMFLLRIMVETEFLVTKLKSHIYEFVANHIRTQRAENFSKKSMRNRFGSKPFSDGIVHNVRQWLLKMVQHIDLHYK
ncbi:hypothetical protein SAMN05192574_105279 [Mucilaginibacter gossypiicola]|uniref:Uncharacterized protein n=1 Tax=Mucilaginibacter gossypiicola TaxID=551995 RepID=A0A1H8LX04_9SPHI|nr:hypothetical protein [Mucilaginibacter gossypiicola]SEO09428.1 hypothetical protein SAMN05192574_105279 [Mucilaginibacter gossypiicola]